MPNKCGIVNCRGNYDLLSKRRIFKLPRLDPERQRWLAVIPPRKDFNVANAKSFFICKKHWPQNPPMKKLPGGTTRPAVAPSIFDVPASCLPTPQIPPRPAKQVDKQLDVFMARDRIKSFSEFLPDKKLHKEYNNVVITRRSDRCAFLFMSSDFRECEMTVLVENKSTLCSPLTCFAYKSIMVSVTPVHKLTASFQFEVVKQAAMVVEQAGGTVLGSITDNHKINQLYCKMFDRPSESDYPATATHPLDNTRSWYLLFDTVHLLKCIRNNWISGESTLFLICCM